MRTVDINLPFQPSLNSNSNITMSRVSSNVFPRLTSLARAKMHSVFGGRGAKEDSTSLHRWVLLKNSLVASHPCLPEQESDHEHEHDAAACSVSISEVDEEVDSRDHVNDQDVFTFPLLDDDGEAPSPTGSSESEWLDSLLETLGDDSDGEDEYVPPTPPASPCSSLDDLGASSFYAHVHGVAQPSTSAKDSARSAPIAIPYPVPYPPLYSLDSEDAPTAVSMSSPMPVFMFDAYPPPPYPPILASGGIDPADLPVPDWIEDTSDDESDAPLTPSSISSGPTLPSLVAAHRLNNPGLQRMRPAPRIYIPATSTEYDYFFDPLPFGGGSVAEPQPQDEDAHEQHRHNRGPGIEILSFGYQEC
jgi:hypothetical protein